MAKRLIGRGYPAPLTTISLISCLVIAQNPGMTQNAKPSDTRPAVGKAYNQKVSCCAESEEEQAIKEVAEVLRKLCEKARTMPPAEREKLAEAVKLKVWGWGFGQFNEAMEPLTRSVPKPDANVFPAPKTK